MYICAHTHSHFHALTQLHTGKHAHTHTCTHTHTHTHTMYTVEDTCTIILIGPGLAHRFFILDIPTEKGLFPELST
jgi:hypothetical protein